MKKSIYTAALVVLSFNAHSWEIGALGDFSFDQLSPKVHVLHGPIDTPNVSNEGFMNNPGIIIGDKGVTLVDPGSSYYAGKKLILEIEEITKKPIVAIFNTHVHGDHWLGNHAIAEKYPNVTIYSSQTMLDKIINDDQGQNWIDMITKYTEGLTVETKVVKPTETVVDQQQIVVGSETFIIHAPTKLAHTDTDIMIEHVGSKTLFLGDNLFNGRFGRFDSSSDMHSNLEVLEYTDGKFTTYVPGHGQSGTAEETLHPFLNYLKVIKEASYAGYEDDLADYEIKPDVLKVLTTYVDWVSYNSIGMHINKMLSEVENRDL